MSTLDAARAAIARGWAPVAIPAGGKRPVEEDWVNLRYSSDRELEDAFPEGMGLGVVLGAASGNLVDVDLDCDEARRLARSFLPRTPLTHGRESSPDSHFWYVVDVEVATKQFKDPTNKSMLLELRSTGGQTNIPPTIHPSGEALEWSDDNADPAEISKGRLLTHVKALAAATLLAKHWPASGGRHDATLALAGGMLRSGWSEKNVAYFVCEVGEAVDPGVDRSDRTAAVKSTAALLAKDRKISGWPTLARDLGEAVVEKVREWLDLEDDEAEEETGDSSLVATDLGDLLAQGIDPPKFLLDGILYRERVHWWQGEPGDGKTFLLLGLSLRLMREGYKVMWVDEESGSVQTAFRLQSYGAEPEVVRSRMIYFDRPGLTISDEDRAALFTFAKEEKPDLVVFDSAADVLVQAGLDEDSNGEVTRYVKTIMEPLAHDYGCAVVAIDHVTKSKDTRGGWARGAGSKKSKSDVAWKVVKVNPFSVDTVGLIRLEQAKDRDGWLPQRHAFKIGGQGGRTLLEPIEEVKSNTKVPEGEIEARVVEFLRLNAPGEIDAVTTSAVRSSVEGKSEAITAALEGLVRDSATGVRVQERGRKRVFWYESQGYDIDFGGVE